VTYAAIEGGPSAFCGLLPGAAPAQVGTPMTIGIDGTDCHLFDSDSVAFERRIPLTEIDPTLLAAAGA
jgi:multiple sugar transport system ATP-binding protein